VRHAEIGLVCELWCYEGGPFQYGKASKRQDGSVVFVHAAGKMTATTTFVPSGEGRVLMDILVQGPIEELKTVAYMGPCMQLWHSEKFKRADSLVEFARRCFLYTVRGPVGMLDTARGPMKSFKPEAPENNPPYTQWYVPFERAHPGDIWAFGASGDRPLYGLVGVVSRDDRWLAAIGCARTRTLGQGWHDCIHYVPELQPYLDEGRGDLSHRTALYVMPNDKQELLRRFQQDFPPRPDGRIRVSTAKGGVLNIGSSSQNSNDLKLSLDVISDRRTHDEQKTQAWEVSPWGGFVRRGGSWQMWAWPHHDVLDFWVSLAQGSGSALVKATLNGHNWQPTPSPNGVPALVRRSSNGSGIAALIWERSEMGNPASGVAVPGQHQNVTSVRGRLYLIQGGVELLREHWMKSEEEWRHSLPYRMPLEVSAAVARHHEVHFAPNLEQEMTYGLTVIPPWKDGGTLHVNFPEHFEHGIPGYGILRYSDKRDNPWKIASDGRSANYEVESPELRGVMVRASAEAQGDRALLTLKIVNGGKDRLERIKPLLCFWYAKLTGFPGKLSNNFENTYVIRAGQLLNLRSIPTVNPEATAKVAYVRGCSQHDCDQFALRRGGLIEEDVDKGLIAVTDKAGTRKIVITFTPGKSILSNAVIPCAHADPYLGALAPGEFAEAKGVILFAETPLDKAVASLE
jgi:hypothetical protein